MFNFTKEEKEKYYAKAEETLKNAGLECFRIDRDRFCITEKSREVRIYFIPFSKTTVSAKKLAEAKKIENIVVVNDRYSKTNPMYARALRENAYMRFPMGEIEDNVCIFEIYDATYKEVCTVLKQIEKESEEEFDKLHPKPYLPCVKEGTEKYREEVVCQREPHSIDEKEGFCRFYIKNEQPELIHGLLRYLGKNLGKAELMVNDKQKRPYAATNYGVYVSFQLEVDKDEYEKEKVMFIEENKQRKAGSESK